MNKANDRVAVSVPAPGLPSGVRIFERGWLSSNSLLIIGHDGPVALIDSGYHSHATQTLVLVQAALPQRALDILLNTHLHSDHCGGNAALQAAYPALQTLIPPGQSQQVRHWNPQALGYTPTGQYCPAFGFAGLLQPGDELPLGDALWQVHGAPGHDPHSVILFEPISRTLVSADALWERGFGVVFPQRDGADAFDEVAATLALIATLRPAVVIPGHGRPFTDVTQALAVARQRLDGFVANPQRHQQHAARVLLKFKLLEARQLTRPQLHAWAGTTAYLQRLLSGLDDGRSGPTGVLQVADELVRSGAASWDGNCLLNA